MPHTADIRNCRLPVTRLLDRDLLQRIVDSGLLPLETRSPELQAKFERLMPEATKRAAEISEHNAQVLLKILHEHFLEVLLCGDSEPEQNETNARTSPQGTLPF